MLRNLALAAVLLALLAVPLAGASYTITHITTQLSLNANNTASVREIYTIYLTNSSISQYQSSRSALNLTLSNWQPIIGSALTQHIINPKSGVYGFKLFPGPLTTSITGEQLADIIITYGVKNVTSVREIAPRVFFYSFNTQVLNFQYGPSGEILDPNTTLTIIMPSGATIKNVYPVPDLPANLLTSNFTNVTSMSWFYQEPLSKFSLTFTTQQSVQGEVIAFFSAAYNFLGVFTYILIILVVFFFILYTYLKVER